MFCDKHQHAFIKVCSECVVERIKSEMHTVQHSVLDVEEEQEADDETFALKP